MSQDDFILMDSCNNSNFNYKSIQRIDYCDSGMYLEKVFGCVKGKADVYRFIRKRRIGVDIPLSSLYDSTHIGYDSTMKEVIIVKVEKGMITDAYYFHLSLAEGPASAFLLRSRRCVKFGNFISTDSLKFKPVDRGENMLSRKKGLLILHN